MKRSLGVAAIAVSALTTTALSLSANADFYLGAQSGSTDYGTLAKNVSSLELTMGYALTRNFAFEFSWLELGETDLPVYDRFGNEIAETQFGIDGTQFAFVAFIPLDNDFSLFGRFGVLSWDQESNNITTSNLIQTNNNGEEDSDFVYGGGLVWHVVDQIDFRLQYQGIDVSGDDIENVSAGITYSF